MKIDWKQVWNHKDESLNWASAQALFWIIFIAIWLYFSPPEWSYARDIFWAFSNTLFYFLLVNINWVFLLPGLLKNQSMLIYTAALIGIGLFLCPLKILLNTWFCSDNLSCAPWITDSKFHCITLIIVPALSSLVKIPIDWLKVQKERRELITKNIHTELQFLKNQVNPHFLFNTLNNLYALTLKKSDNAPDVVLRLSDMMRYMLYECNEKEVPLEKEIQYIKNYIELEKLRLSSSADIQLNIKGDVNGFKIAPLLFIPFIENSFKHGIKYSTSNAYIHIHFYIEDSNLIFMVKNSKKEQLPGHFQNKKVGGIGLVNVKKRLELIYPETYALDISNEPQDYSIHLSLETKTNL